MRRLKSLTRSEDCLNEIVINYYIIYKINNN